MAILEIIYEIKKVCYEETKKSVNKYVVSENSFSKNVINFQEKYLHEVVFF